MVWNNTYDANTDLDQDEWSPQNLQAQGISDSQIRLTWSRSDYRISGYKIQRQTNSGSFTQIAAVNADITEFTDTGLNLTDNFYTYRIAAYTSTNQSEYSNLGTVPTTDIDGNIYQTVRIGDQIWLAENLKVTHYRNEDAIPHLANDGDWTSTQSGAFCAYFNDEGNVAANGRLYNWYAVADSRNIAPEGWHVPTNAEWKQLEMYLGMNQSEADNINWRGTDEGGKLKEASTINWSSPNTGATNESGFTALPSGSRSFSSGSYGAIGTYSYFWSSTENSNSGSWQRMLSYNSSEILRSIYNKHQGLSVRCVRD